MTIYEKIDSILATIKIDDVIVPFFYGMQEFSETSPEPDNYIIYDFYSKPLYTGDGKFKRERYYITISVFTASNLTLGKTVRDTLISNDFIYSQDLQVSEDKTFPYHHRETKEFNLDMEVI